ncbi:MAG TPA: 2-dehydropantoate 2-reductase [Sphingomicrobium sp.]|nr:2-dehydropantoate 2-reductase [Sphingomicrobium sp.]
MPPTVAILGAGSVGCFLGGAWAIAGVPVTFIGRSKLASEIQSHGLTVSDFSGREARVGRDQVDYRCSPDALAAAQLIAVTVKSADTSLAAAQIAEHARAGTTIISFQNGVSNIDVLEQCLGGRMKLARGMVAYNVAYLGAGRFHKGVAGELYADCSPETQALAQAVANGLAPLRLSDNMLGLAWGKLLINLNNAVNALSGKTLREELSCRGYRRVFAASIREGLGLLDRAQIKALSPGPISIKRLPLIIDLPDWLFNNIFLKRWKIDEKARSSMADDLGHGRRTEVDYLNGEFVRLAEKLHSNAPVNRAIAELVHAAERGAPPLSPAELRAALLGGQR